MNVNIQGVLVGWKEPLKTTCVALHNTSALIEDYIRVRQVAQ